MSKIRGMHPLLLITQKLSLNHYCRWRVEGRRVSFQEPRKSEKVQYLLIDQEWYDENPSILTERLKTKKLTGKTYKAKGKEESFEIFIVCASLVLCLVFF